MKRPTLPYAAPTLVVRPIRPADAGTVVRLIRERWGETVVVHGAEYRPTALPGFLAMNGAEVVGLLTYHVDGDAWEVVTIDSWEAGGGVGTALLQAVRAAAQAAGAQRVWLITTNDKLDALRFYQRRGFALVAVHADAVAAARRIKPAIPLVGAFAIPIRDEIELEFRLPLPRPRVQRVRATTRRAAPTR